MDLREQKIEGLSNDLIKEGRLTPDQLAVAKESQKNLGGDLAQAIVERGFLTEEELTQRLGKKYGYTVINLTSYKPDPTVLKLLSAEQAHHWKLLPLFEAEERLTVATADPFNLAVLDEAKAEIGKEIECVLVTLSAFRVALEKFYGVRPNISQKKSASVEVYSQDDIEEAGAPSPIAQLEKEALGSKVVAVVNQLFKQAYEMGASDIHLEPTRYSLKVRMRVDGVLMEVPAQPKKYHQPMISRVKILGNMDVAERRVPQDGRMRLRIEGKEIDLRIATYPTIFGEAAAIRMLTQEQLRTMDDLGFSKKDQKIFAELIQKPHGVFLVTGPTGSGKSTTLYSALLGVDRKKRHVLSVEDPVEHEIEGVDQTQVAPKAGVTFASELRALLRQDPDIIMVGEIRDSETADITLRAAMTGHLVFSTLHTNTAIGAVSRLLNLGLEPYLISSTVIGMLAQRLVRRICIHCKEEVPLTPEQSRLLGERSRGLRSFIGKGCRHCRMSGYKGRVGMFEMVKVDEEMRVLINTRAPEVRLQERAYTAGSHTLLEDGLEKVKAGITSIDEILHVVSI
ncbi:MAG: ATPase, T2SS/T4P/T4SS family [Deltaproteobacteria bacterium]|nr:ATPase, T2SS/T4P/T4SS family [Deltaproteobacteria bacterium]